MRTDNAILLSALAILIVGYNLWPRLWTGAYYQSIAIGFFLLFLTIKRLNKGAGLMDKVATIGLFLSLNNLLDEIFFDPKVFGINEYIVATIIITVTLLRNGRKRK